MKSDLELSDFVITSPYTMTSADIKAVSKASNGNPQKEDWEKSSLKAYKDRVTVLSSAAKRKMRILPYECQYSNELFSY